MRTLLEVAIFLIVISVPAFVLLMLILVLSPLVFGDSIPRHDDASGQDVRIAQTARAEAPQSDTHESPNDRFVRGYGKLSISFKATRVTPPERAQENSN